jgi:O-antigen ligase
MLEDFDSIVLFFIGSYKVYLIDLVYVLLLYCVCDVIIDKKKMPSKKESFAFIAFLIWLCWGILYGFNQNGFRSLGEGRVIIYGLLAFFVPFYLPIERTPENITKIISRSIFAAGVGAFAMFIIELFNGGRFFFSEIMRNSSGSFGDFRGIRMLSTEHTYALCACVILLFYSIKEFRSMPKGQFITIIFLLTAILISKNRTATISLFSLFALRLIFQRNLKGILGILALTILILVGIRLIVPDSIEPINDSFLNLSDVSSDPTGNVRILLQKATLELAMEHPIIGQGYGGYFNLYIPELNIVMQNQPHSEYAYLFLKSGIIGVILAVVPILVICRKLFRMNKYHRFIGGTDILSVLSILIGSQIIYGFAFNFSLFYGLYFGFAVLLLDTLNNQTINTKNIQVPQ